MRVKCKIYISLERDPVNYVSITHNFETCLEKGNSHILRRLQLVIHHCTRKAREAVESWVKTREAVESWVKKETLRDNFGRLHIKVQAHVKLESLVPLKQKGGPRLLEFSSRHEVAKRTLLTWVPNVLRD